MHVFFILYPKLSAHSRYILILILIILYINTVQKWNIIFVFNYVACPKEATFEAICVLFLGTFLDGILEIFCLFFLIFLASHCLCQLIWCIA
jgi:hypothetical protein